MIYPELNLNTIPLIITLTEKAEMKIIKSDILCPASDGNKFFSEIDACIKKTGYDGSGGEPEIKYFSDLNKKSCRKEESFLSVYEFKQKGVEHVSLSKMFYKLFSLVDGDLRKMSLNIDQMEHVILSNKSFISEINHWPSIFFIEADFKIFPVSIRPQPGGYGELFETKIHHFGEMACYQRVRFFMPFN